jgi:hypothetical protein
MGSPERSEKVQSNSMWLKMKNLYLHFWITSLREIISGTFLFQKKDLDLLLA